MTANGKPLEVTLMVIYSFPLVSIQLFSPSCASVPSKKEFFRCSNFPFKMNQSIPTLGASNPIFMVCSRASTKKERRKEILFYFLSMASTAIIRLVATWCEMHNSKKKRRREEEDGRGESYPIKYL